MIYVTICLETVIQVSIDRLTCPCCARTFENLGAKSTHVTFAHPEYHLLHLPTSCILRANTRMRFTNAQKSAAMDKHFEFLLDPACPDPYTATTKWVLVQSGKNEKVI